MTGPIRIQRIQRIQKLPWVLLAVSLVFNLAFSGGFLQARSTWPLEAEAGGLVVA